MALSGAHADVPGGILTRVNAAPTGPGYWKFQDVSANMAHMALPGPDWRGLAEHVKRRRNAFGLTQADVQAAGGPSVALIRQIENGVEGNYRGTVIGRLEQALRWQPGSIEAILGGGGPTPMQGSTGYTNGASTISTSYTLPGGRVVTATEPLPVDAAHSPFSEETEAELRRIAANPARSPGLRAMAAGLLSQLSALREADAAEREAEERPAS